MTMASAGEVRTDCCISSLQGKQPVGMQQRRMELEREVAELQETLREERRLREVLKQSMLLLPELSPGRMSLRIPASLPKKAKELLAELIVVEEEIARLESEISEIRGGLRSPRPASMKSLFYINQAMKNESLAGKATSPRLSLDSIRRFGRKALPESPRTSNSAASPVKEARGGRKIAPNKLSERMIKCLMCIYVRVMRAARAAEAERSGGLAKLGHSLLSSPSFRAPAISSGGKQKDPYGIFGIEGSVRRDIGPYKNLVQFTSSSFDSRGLSDCTLLLRNLRDLLADLDRNVDAGDLWTRKQKLAFWINIHNACIMNGILQFGLPTSREKLLALRKEATLSVGRAKLNATAIEEIVRRAQRQADGEPNVAFALCSGSRSSPAVRIYTAERVTEELDKAKLEYLQASIAVVTTPAPARVMIPSLLQSNARDLCFSRDEGVLARWVSEQLPASCSLRRSIVECLRAHGGAVVVLPFDYEFQFLLPM